MEETSNQSLPPLRRVPLAVETARILRLAIKDGQWSESLPSERALERQFQVSRPTVRSALKLLEKEGVVEIRHGCPTKIIGDESSGQSKKSAKVILLTSLPGLDRSPRLAYFMDEIDRYVRKAGFEFSAINDKRTGSHKPQKALESLVSKNPNCSWILFGSNAPTQKWFSEKKIPALLLGSPFAEEMLPSIGLDMRATCRHAAGRLLALGHQHLGLFLPKERLAGDISSIEGIQEAMASSKTEPRLSLVEHDRSLMGQKKAIHGMLRMKRRPTGLIICGASSVLATIPVILAAGVRIPEDLSIICRESEIYLQDLGIDVTRYRINKQSHARRVAQLAVQLKDSPGSMAFVRHVEPNFHAGETICPPADS